MVVANLTGSEPERRYDGYTSCPLVTARHRMLLAEFDYDLKPTPTIPLIDTTNERYDMWLLKRYGLPALYRHGMLKESPETVGENDVLRPVLPGLPVPGGLPGR